MPLTGFASVDGTDGFTRSGHPISFTGLFRHKDDYNRLYFELDDETYDQLLTNVNDDDNVSPFYADAYWKVNMAKGRFDKTVDIEPIVKKIDNRLIHTIKGQLYQMAEGSIIDGKPYSGSYLQIESVTPLAKQPKEIQTASADYLKRKAAKDAAEAREDAKEKPKKRKAASKKKSTKASKKKGTAKKTKAVKTKLIEQEAEDEDGDEDNEDEAMEE
jgi:hypothetical protein